jgi:membrane fusion protein (multidrug efflux system)
MNARRWLITVAACVLVFAALAGYKFFQIRAAIAFGKSFPEPSAAVQILTVERSIAPHHVTTIGELVAPESLQLRNEPEGRVIEVNMVSGARVRKGEVVLRMDISEESARLAAARASAALAALNLERMRKLLKSNTISQDRVDQAQAESDVARARVGEIQAIVDKKTLRAPFDAVVGLHDIEPGEYLNANTPLVWLVGIRDYLWLDFSLPLVQGRLAVGDTVAITLSSRDNDKREATVIAVSPAISPQSRNLRYRARIAAAAALTPNAVVNVSVRTGELARIAIPTPALLRDETGPYVFVLEAEPKGGYRARRQSVRLGVEGKRTVAVLDGLQSGQTIATHGAFKLRHGMLAHLQQRSSPRADVNNAE